MKNIIFDFEYLAPKTLEEALTLLSQYDEEERKVIAGGQSLLVIMRQRLVMPQYLIDIKGLTDLDYIKFDEKEGLKIGALTTHRSVEKSPVIQKEFSVLSEMEENLSNVETRNWGTIGGDIAHSDPCADPVPVLIALNARLKMAGQMERESWMLKISRWTFMNQYSNTMNCLPRFRCQFCRLIPALNSLNLTR